MKMIKTLTIAVILGLSISVHAEGMPASTTFEISIFSVRMPVSENGTLAVQECADCDYHSIRVTPNTVYSLNNSAMELDDFRKALTDLRQDGDITVNVKRDDASNTVVNVFILKQ